MDSRIRSAGPAGWLLAFLGARERALRPHTGLAAGPAEWLLVFLEVERDGLASRQRPAAVPPNRENATGQHWESPFGRLTARSA
ncbi:hypothetical protein [Actinomadura decatromicini]|uniref:Uncharacterized protein n=1 Tax=Actinomadura decatromicini TaxID=2604572 RepID=A0A5D3FFP9_9ACTN|nr:hypothetical protein [Actinomadura decatromicini]TYK46788.1 hypothetical protein FXF68_23385 [Actinomadura decatromicini]